jgi:hypothetical protein
VTTLADALKHEQHWIETFALNGHPLTNRFDVVSGSAARIYEKLLKMDRSA